jgi:hypothetical protein
MNKFWEKVEKCDHKNLTDHFGSISCETPYCYGSESHCRDCGVYITECACGYNNGLSGWPESRHKKQRER